MNLYLALVLLHCLYPQQLKDIVLQKSLHSQYHKSAAGFSSWALQAKKNLKLVLIAALIKNKVRMTHFTAYC